MEAFQNNRLVRRFFKCIKCKEIEAKLVNPFVNNNYCSKCSSRVNEISENDYKKYKNREKEKMKQKEDIKVENNMPYKPKEELLKKVSEKYNNKQPSKEHHHKHKNNDNHHHKNGDNHHHNHKKYNRHQSSTHYSNMNFNNINNYNNNINNINNIHVNNYNNINNINFNDNINNNNINNNYENRHRHKHERRENNNNHNNRRRDHSTNPSNTFFSDFFRGMGFQPFMEFDFSIETPFMNNGHGHNPFRITIQRQNVSNDIFDPIFSSFGSIFNGVFQDNFSSNFSSNYRGNFFDEIIRILERNQEEARRKAHPPASEESLKKLKKFNMNEKYCKKDKKGKYELPNCCICLSEIGKGEKTFLLPCGHMFHWKCCLTWLKSNNTCPMCRFVIK